VDIPDGISDSNGTCIEIDTKFDDDRDILIKGFLENDAFLWSVSLWWDLL